MADRLRLRDIGNASTFRLTARFDAVFAISVTAPLGSIHGLSARELSRRSEHVLQREALLLETAPSPACQTGSLRKSREARAASTIFGLRSADGERIAGNMQIAANVPGSELGLSLISAILQVHGFAPDCADARPDLVACIVCCGTIAQRPLGEIHFTSPSHEKRRSGNRRCMALRLEPRRLMPRYSV